MHSVDGVLSLLPQIVEPVPAGRVSLDEARGACLAREVTMDQDTPPFNRSQLDGFGVRAESAKLNAELEIVGKVDAGGKLFEGTIGPGQAVAINTGGVVPAGVDGVLMVEHSEVIERGGKKFVKVMKGVPAGYGIQPQGSDARKGDVVLAAGVRLTGSQLAVCAAAGVWEVEVRRPVVGVLSTGDELIDGPGGAEGAGKIRNSNGPMLRALSEEAGGRVLDLGSCRDEAALIEERLRDGLARCDLLVVCGGMSMGTRDHVPALLKKMGVTIHVEKVKMKPGKPFLFGTVELEGRRKYVAGLPGNPVSSFVTFQLFGRLALGHMAGAARPGLRRVRAVSAQALEENGDREFFQPCVLAVDEEGRLKATVLKWKGSADLFTIARADGLLVRPINGPATAAGVGVEVLSW